MSLPAKDYFTGAKLTFKAFADPTDTKTVWVIDRPVLDANSYGTYYWPLIKEISEIGIEMDEFLPKELETSLRLNNEIGSFGKGYRLSDLLARYTLIEQRIEIYMKAVAIGANAVTFEAGDLVWLGKVATVDLDVDDTPEIGINAVASLIPDKQIGYQITETDSDKEQSIGKWLPVPIGNYCYLPAYTITEYEPFTTNLTRWAYASTLCGLAGAISSVIAQDSAGQWVELETYTSTYAKGSEATSYSLDSAAAPGRLFEIENDSAQNAMLVNIYLTMKGNGTGGRTSTCIMTVTVYEIAKNQEPMPRSLASATYDLSADDSSNNSPIGFGIWLPLDRPVVMNAATHYYAVGVTATGWATGEASINKSELGTCRTWQKTISGEWASKGTIKAPAMSCHMLDLSFGTGFSTTANLEGSKAILQTTNESGAVSYPPLDNYASVNVQIKTTGTADDGSGTITGSASSVITRPDHVAKLITGNWTGSAWEASTDWDFTTLATEYAAAYGTDRRLVGYQDAPVTLREMLEAICRDSGSRIGVNNSGKLFLWPWGYDYTPVADIPPGDIVPQSWSISDASTVVNQVAVNYGNTNVDVLYLRNRKQQKNFSGIVDRSVARLGVAQANGANSVTLFGRRYLSRTDTNYVGSLAAAETLADSLFIRYSKPLILASFNVPLDTYKALKPLDVITFEHTAFPAFYGAAPASNAPKENGDFVELKSGRYWYAGQRYRGLIEGRRIIKDPEGVPMLQIQVQVLQNSGVDPT
jgi:hypothetical protein